MVQTVYPASYADQISIFDFNMRPGPSLWPRPDCPAPYKNCAMGTNPGRTHRFYTGKAVVPFGFGLSYTTFEYSLTAPRPTNISLARLEEELQSLAGQGKQGGWSQAQESLLGPSSIYQVKVGPKCFCYVCGWCGGVWWCF